MAEGCFEEILNDIMENNPFEFKINNDDQIDTVDANDIGKHSKEAMELALHTMAETALEKNLRRIFVKEHMRTLVEKAADTYLTKMTVTHKDLKKYRKTRDAEIKAVNEFLQNTNTRVEHRLQALEKSVKQFSEINNFYKEQIKSLCKTMKTLEKNCNLLSLQNQTYKTYTEELGDKINALKNSVQKLLLTGEKYDSTIPEPVLKLLLHPLTTLKKNTQKKFNTQYPILEKKEEHLLSYLRLMGFDFEYRSKSNNSVTCTLPKMWQNTTFVDHVNDLRKRKRVKLS